MFAKKNGSISFRSIIRSNYKRNKLTQIKINKLENIKEWYWLLYNKWNQELGYQRHSF